MGLEPVWCHMSRLVSLIVTKNSSWLVKLWADKHFEIRFYPYFFLINVSRRILQNYLLQKHFLDKFDNLQAFISKTYKSIFCKFFQGRGKSPRRKGQHADLDSWPSTSKNFWRVPASQTCKHYRAYDVTGAVLIVLLQRLVSPTVVLPPLQKSFILLENHQRLQWSIYRRGACMHRDLTFYLPRLVLKHHVGNELKTGLH